VREYLRDLDENFAERTVDYGGIRDLGSRILAIGEVRARGRASGAEIDAPYGILVEFRDGMALRLRHYFYRTEALEAAGLEG
jgi:ketosteroid isomerase-like protein